MNYLFGRWISINQSKAVLTIAIILNLTLLAYFKYAVFFASISGVGIGDIILPLAISFFTFQQIAYLVDTLREPTPHKTFIDYCLFVTFFPQLIAGPIVYHKNLMPQFSNRTLFRINAENLSIGLTFFIIGLFKKVVIADELALYTTPVFNAADTGSDIYFIEAWVAALAYTFQLYFDFSAYSDMAIGLARMVGIQLPLNFFSPYKATSIIDFWRRWHITLSKFLRDYLYIPLGGGRDGNSNRYRNIMIVMMACGLWHGAGWNFLIWGGLHGVYLIINHVWHSMGVTVFKSGFGVLIAWAITFLSVIISWIFFRSQTWEGAIKILSAMIGLNGISLPHLAPETILLAINNLNINVLTLGALPIIDTGLADALIILMSCALLVFLMPNTAQIMRTTFRNGALQDIMTLEHKHHLRTLQWTGATYQAAAIGCITAISILCLTRINDFLYFQF